MLFFPAKQNATPGGYRSDIDGLRAFAVLAVILYHFDVKFFKGGFIGVDIFFVISGYLITKGIISLRENNKFSIGDFYTRRARRLFPALIATIAATYALSFAFFSPTDFMAMSGSTVYALTGISNIYFWLGSGYFDNFASLKPLLHTWSLSVELQFYLVWPFIILGLMSFGRRSCAIGVLAFTVVAAALSVYYVYVNSTSAFFLTQFRMHEFAIGAIVVFIERVKINTAIKYALYAIGMLMVFIPSLVFDVNKINFPGYYALIPCIGAALMIWNGGDIKISKILSNRPVSHIGEISYSLYLIHWPVYVFANYFLIGYIDMEVKLAMLVVTFALSFASYRLIELPFRNPKNSKLSGSAFALSCSGIALIFTVLSSSSWANKGWEWRMPEGIREINKISHDEAQGFTWQAQGALSLKSGFDPSHAKKRILFIGDSQSADVVNMMSASGNIDKYDAVARTVLIECGTPYISEDEFKNFFTKENPYTIKRPEMIPECQKMMATAMDENLLKSADKIFISFFIEPHSEKIIEEAVAKIRSITNAEITVFGRKNLKVNSVDIVNSLGRTAGINRFASKFKDPETFEINKSMTGISGVKFVNMMDYVCPSDKECIVLTDAGKPIFYDKAHVTKSGAKFLGDKVFNQ